MRLGGGGGGRAGERGRRVTAEANCGPFLSEVLLARVKLRVTLPRHSDWVLVPVLIAASVCVYVCVYTTAGVFLYELRAEGQKAHLFLIPQKALLSGPGGAGVPVEDCEGEGGEERASERSHHRSGCRGRCGAMWPVCNATSSSTAASFTLTLSKCKQVQIFVKYKAEYMPKTVFVQKLTKSGYQQL